MCLSGTIYTYRTELEEWVAPHLYEVEIHEGASKLALETVVANVNELTQANITALVIPREPDRTYQVTVRKEGDTGRFGTSYYVNPYTSDITGTSLEKTATANFMGSMFSLHRWLLLDRIDAPLIGELPNRKLGSYITGTATILFTLGLITGLIIWVPRKIKYWKKGLKIKWDGNWKRINHDLHHTLAFYSLIFLLLKGLTGPQWSFPWYREALQKTLGTYQEAAAGTSPRGGKPENKEAAPVELLPIEDYLASADQVLSYQGDYGLSLPKNGNSNVEITKNRSGFFAPAAGDKLTLDATTAKVIAAEIFREKPFNERLAGSIKALHLGNVYGQFSKLLYFFACLIATSLPVTGTLIWINKLRKRRKELTEKNQKRF